jgi:hypothetical protein
MKYLKNIAIAILLFVASLASSCSVFAQEVPIGLFAGETYFYESDAIVRNKDMVGAWVISHSQTFNITKITEYDEAAVLFQINCSDGTAAVVASIIFDKDRHVLNQYRIAQDDWNFIAVQNHTPAASLFRILCLKAPRI